MSSYKGKIRHHTFLKLFHHDDFKGALIAFPSFSLTSVPGLALNAAPLGFTHTQLLLHYERWLVPGHLLITSKEKEYRQTDTHSKTSQLYLEVRFTSGAQWKSRVFTLTTATFTHTTVIAEALQKRIIIYIHRAVFYLEYL